MVVLLCIYAAFLALHQTLPNLIEPLSGSELLYFHQSNASKHYDGRTTGRFLSQFPCNARLFCQGVQARPPCIG